MSEEIVKLSIERVNTAMGKDGRPYRLPAPRWQLTVIYTGSVRKFFCENVLDALKTAEQLTCP